MYKNWEEGMKKKITKQIILIHSTVNVFQISFFAISVKLFAQLIPTKAFASLRTILFIFVQIFHDYYRQMLSISIDHQVSHCLCLYIFWTKYSGLFSSSRI